MSVSQTLGGPSRCGRIIGPSLDKIIKNAAWRKHSHLVAACKSALDKLETVVDFSASNSDPQSPLAGFSAADAQFVLQPLVIAIDSAYPKVVEPALDCGFKLFSLELFRGEIDGSVSGDGSVLSRMIDSVCKISAKDAAIEVAALRFLFSAVRSRFVLIRGDCLVHLVKTCYNVYLGGMNGTNQICAKAVLAQIVIIVFTRMEADSMDVGVKTISVNELLEMTDKELNEGSSIHFCQNFVNEVMAANEAVVDNATRPWLEPPDDNAASSGTINGEGEELNEGEGVGVISDSKIREDGFQLYKNLCKLSMRTSSQENTDNQILVRGKTLSLELLKLVMDNAGYVWRTDEK